MADGLPKYPIVIYGFIKGPVRLETLEEAPDWYPPQWNNSKLKVFHNQKPIQHPTLVDGEGRPLLYAITHLQKKSKFGFLHMSPEIKHFWFSFKQQEQDPLGMWKPGTEIVAYGRTPGQRWSKEGFVTSKGFLPQGHWD